MAIRFNIPKRQLAGLAIVRDLGADRLEWVAKQLSSLKQPLAVGDLERPLRTELSEEEAVELLRQLLSVSALGRYRNLGADTVFEGLTRGLASIPTESRWSEEDLKRWRDLKPQLVRLFELPPVNVVAKALDLSYDYVNLLQHTRIVTDIRPVFDENEEGIAGAVVSQTLRLVFSSSDGTHSLSIAMDANDIQLLRRSCERALKKVVTAEEQLLAKLDIPVLVAGENSTTNDGG